MRDKPRATGLSWPLRTGALCGMLASTLGVLVLLGWIGRSTVLIQLAPRLPAMPMSVAASLVLSGFGILGAVASRRRLVFICSGIAATAAVISIFEVDGLSPIAAICLVILAATLVLCQMVLFEKPAPFLGIAGLVVAGIGVACWVSVISGASDAPIWGGLTRMSVHTALGLFLLGMGSAALAWDASLPAASEPMWIPIGAGLIVGIFRVGLWRTYGVLNHSKADFIFNLALLGSLTSAIVFGVFVHLALKTYLQREALRRVNGRLEEEIAERKIAEEVAQAANRAKSEFLANMSHEIRTPMTGVLGMIDLLRLSQLSEQQNEQLEMARSSAGSLLSLLNDILDISKIEAGRLDLAPTAFSVRRCVGDAVSMFEVRVRQKELTLSTQVDSGVPDTLFGDPLRLRQVLVNLVGNAVKFTDEGRVAVRVGLETQNDSEAVILVQVTDTGTGIPAEKCQLIFDPFRQADGSTARRYGGVGLGLTISARLVELMGGTITVRSELGKGSTFSFTARIAHASLEAKAQFAKASRAMHPPPICLDSRKRSLRILLAEDTAVNQKLVATLLKREGHEVSVVGNGLEAIAAAKAAEFDLVLMDIQMPLMDGFEATSIIREAERDKHTPIVAMTAHAMKGDDEKCIEAGMDDYLSKPINFADLRAMIDKWAPAEGLLEREGTVNQTLPDPVG